jgi:hypothetical protein
MSYHLKIMLNKEQTLVFVLGVAGVAGAGSGVFFLKQHPPFTSYKSFSCNSVKPILSNSLAIIIPPKIILNNTFTCCAVTKICYIFFNF